MAVISTTKSGDKMDRSLGNEISECLGFSGESAVRKTTKSINESAEFKRGDYVHEIHFENYVAKFFKNGEKGLNVVFFDSDLNAIQGFKFEYYRGIYDYDSMTDEELRNYGNVDPDSGWGTYYTVTDEDDVWDTVEEEVGKWHDGVSEQHRGEEGYVQGIVDAGDADEYFENYVMTMKGYDGLKDVDKKALEDGKQELYDEMLKLCDNDVMKRKYNVERVTDQIVGTFLRNHGTRQIGESADDGNVKKFIDGVRSILNGKADHFWIPVTVGGKKMYVTGEYASEDGEDGNKDEYVCAYLVRKVDDLGYPMSNVLADGYPDAKSSDDDLKDYFNHLTQQPEKRKVHVTSIEWDADDEEKKENNLPEDFVIEVSLGDADMDDEDVASEVIGDAISDKYGFTHDGFKYEIVKEGVNESNGHENEFIQAVTDYAHENKIGVTVDEDVPFEGAYKVTCEDSPRISFSDMKKFVMERTGKQYMMEVAADGNVKYATFMEVAVESKGNGKKISPLKIDGLVVVRNEGGHSVLDADATVKKIGDIIGEKNVKIDGQTVVIDGRFVDNGRTARCTVKDFGISTSYDRKVNESYNGNKNISKIEASEIVSSRVVFGVDVGSTAIDLLASKNSVEVCEMGRFKFLIIPDVDWYTLLENEDPMSVAYEKAEEYIKSLIDEDNIKGLFEYYEIDDDEDESYVANHIVENGEYVWAMRD